MEGFNFSIYSKGRFHFQPLPPPPESKQSYKPAPEGQGFIHMLSGSLVTYTCNLSSGQAETGESLTLSGLSA